MVKLNLRNLLKDTLSLKNIRFDLLVLSHQNHGFIGERGVNIEDLKQNDFSGTDFEFFITTCESDLTRFYISAFYNIKEIDKGINLLDKWKEFFNEKLKSLK